MTASTTTIMILVATAASAFVLSRIRRWLSNPTVPQARPRIERATVIWVADGDTIDVDRGHGRERVRVIGIDAPETHHPDDALNCPEGHAASAYARMLLPEGSTVWLERDAEERDRYGRLLRHVWMEDPQRGCFRESSLACAMVSGGHAVPMRYAPNTKHAFDIALAAAR